MAPPFDFLERAFAPLLRRVGLHLADQWMLLLALDVWRSGKGALQLYRSDAAHGHQRVDHSPVSACVRTDHAGRQSHAS